MNSASSHAQFELLPADRQQPDRQQRSPNIVLLCRKGSIKRIMQLIYSGVANVNDQIDGWTCLHVAADLGKLNLLRLFLQMGANPNSQTRKGETSLHLAADRGDNIMILDLLQVGADPNITDTTGATPLHVCAKRGNAIGLEAMLIKGGNPNAVRMLGGQTALHLAASSTDTQSSEAVIRVLLQYGANVETTDGQGWTPLQHACRVGNILGVKTLLQVMADTHHQDRFGATAKSIARQYNHPEIVQVLENSHTRAAVRDLYYLVQGDLASPVLSTNHTPQSSQNSSNHFLTDIDGSPISKAEIRGARQPRRMYVLAYNMCKLPRDLFEQILTYV